MKEDHRSGDKSFQRFNHPPPPGLHFTSNYRGRSGELPGPRSLASRHLTVSVARAETNGSAARHSFHPTQATRQRRFDELCDPEQLQLLLAFLGKPAVLPRNRWACLYVKVHMKVLLKV